jgi:hypothetical protein
MEWLAVAYVTGVTKREKTDIDERRIDQSSHPYASGKKTALPNDSSFVW